MSTSLTNLSTATDSNESSPLLATATSFKESLPLNQTYLPDDLLLNFFVRVSVLYYPILSIVSKRFRCLLASLALYQTRKLLNRTESCIYVCLQYGTEESRWFTLFRRPTQVPRFPNPKPQWFSPCFRPFRKEERKSGDNLLISVTTSNFSPCGNFLWNLSTVGSNIYLIGGYIGYKPTSRVFCMDCRSHIWQEAPSMLIARTVPRRYAVNIYLKEEPSKETFIFLETGTCMVYKPKENRWAAVGWEINYIGTAICVIDNVMYCYRRNKVIEWYDDKENCWKILKGLEELPKLPSGVTLVNYGGRIAVSWDTRTCFKMMIWCAEITLEKRLNEHEIYGKVEWCDVVLTVPRSLRLHKKLIVVISV
uniref:F-box domain-containing protein n=1 Tax=Brassica oleracea var. oleracea TaxID=109376 RepID=A0A0D3CGU2_BRAOL